MKIILLDKLRYTVTVLQCEQLVILMIGNIIPYLQFYIEKILVGQNVVRNFSMYVCMYVSTYIHTYIHTYVRTYIHTYIHMYNKYMIYDIILIFPLLD